METRRTLQLEGKRNLVNMEAKAKVGDRQEPARPAFREAMEGAEPLPTCSAGDRGGSEQDQELPAAEPGTLQGKDGSDAYGTI